MPVDEVEAFHTWQDVETTVDGQRNHGQLQLVGQGEGSFLEMGHVTCKASGPLRKHRHTIAFFQYLTRILIGLTNLTGSPFVDEYLMRLLTGIAYEGNLPQRFLFCLREFATRIGYTSVHFRC